MSQQIYTDTYQRSEIRDGMRIDWNTPIAMDDGIILRADIFRPLAEGRYPHIRIILSHAGGAVPLFAERLLDRSEITAVLEKVQAGQAAPPSPEALEQMMQRGLERTFSQLRSLCYDTALSTNSTVLSALQRLVPTSQILLGSDYPFAQETGVRYALSGLAAYAGFSEQDRQDIECSNVLSLFPRLQAEQ